jgi:hypothetical protein
MAGILRVTARWSGAIGLPGYSVFHYRDFSAGGEPTQAQAQNAVDKVRTFFFTVAPLLPNVISVQVLGDVPVIEETTGTMTGIFSANQPANVQGSIGATVEYAAPVGAVVTWRTGTVRNGRIIRGRTFLVPLGRSAFAVDGTLASTALTTINSAANALNDDASDGDLGVYSRPSAPGATDGVWAAVNGHSVPDMGAVLRSRRD